MLHLLVKSYNSKDTRSDLIDIKMYVIVNSRRAVHRGKRCGKVEKCLDFSSFPIRESVSSDAKGIT